MLRLILGEVGSGKTRELDRLIADAVRQKTRSYLIVPEQSTVSAERRMAENLPPDSPLVFEATNFTRLADTFFRSEGGLALRYADRTARTLAMWLALRRLTPHLPEAPELDPASLDRYLSVMRELTAGRVDAERLTQAADEIPDERLSGRLRDVSLILSTYREILSSHYADTENVLGTLAEKMARSDFFSGTAVFFDSFTGFTEQQYAVISALLGTADVTVTLPLPVEYATSLCYKEPEKTLRRLTDLAKAAGVRVDVTQLGGNIRTPSEPIRHLTSHLFTADLKAHASDLPSDGSVRLVEANDPYEAARFVSADILKKTAEDGSLFRDFAVLSGDPELYRGILDVDLARNGIPFFFSRKSDLSALEPLKLVTSAYRVVTGDFRRGDVISVVKCGFSGLTDREADELELYSEVWSLSGDAFRDPAPWKMNPEGFERREENPEDRDKRYTYRWLDDVNRAKEKVLPPLRRLAGQSKKQSVPAHCRALYAFLSELSVPKQLLERAVRAAEDGDRERAELYDRFFDVATGALETLAEMLSDEVVTTDEFSTLFDLVCRTSDVGRIPSSSDEVVIGSADLLRAGGVRHVYLFGANEGEFPGIVRGSGYFSETDRERLAAVGVEIGGTRDLRASRELFGFLRAVSAPTASVTVITNGLSADLVGQRTPSSAVARIRALLPDGYDEIKVSDLPPIALIRSREGALFDVGRLSDDPLFPPLTRALADDGDVKERAEKLVRAAKRSISNNDLLLSKEVAEGLFPDRMTLSHSRLDAFHDCPFSYFLDRVLGLKATEEATFGANHIGLYVHAVLEEFFHRPDRDPESMGPKEIRRFVEDFSRDYLAGVGQGLENTPRLAYLFDKLRRSTELLVQHVQEEISEGEFNRSFTELPLVPDDVPEKLADNPTALRVTGFTDDGGGTLYVNGTVDRVDVAKLGDDVYLRVVDYKTGSKELDLKDVERGDSPQLLLYLFALLKNRNADFEKKLGVPMDRVHPAAVRYLHAVTEKAKLDVPPKSDDAVLEEYEKTITQNGCYLDDDAVFRAMDHSDDHRFSPDPAELRKKANSKKGKKLLATEPEFEKLLEKIEENLRADVKRMRSGCIPATPGVAACRYCRMASVCRKAPGLAFDPSDEGD